jgi:hypothetical protein
MQILQQGDMHALLKKAIAGVLLRTLSNTMPCAWMETAASAIYCRNQSVFETAKNGSVN